METTNYYKLKFEEEYKKNLLDLLQKLETSIYGIRKRYYFLHKQFIENIINNIISNFKFDNIRDKNMPIYAWICQAIVKLIDINNNNMLVNLELNNMIYSNEQKDRKSVV